MSNYSGYAEEIRNQIGHRAFVMLGAKNIAKGIDDVGEYLSFKISGSRKYNYVKVAYNHGKDLYQMTFMKATLKKGITKEDVIDNVYADQMHELIEQYTGLYTSL